MGRSCPLYFFRTRKQGSNPSTDEGGGKRRATGSPLGSEPVLGSAVAHNSGEAISMIKPCPFPRHEPSNQPAIAAINSARTFSPFHQSPIVFSVPNPPPPPALPLAHSYF